MASRHPTTGAATDLAARGRPGATGAQPRPALLVLATSGDLYGSDRGLLAALPEVCEAFDVTIAFPAEGPAIAIAGAAGAEVLVLPDYAFRTRVLHPRAFLGWVRRGATATARLTRIHRRRRFDLIYSNTINNGLGPVLRILWRVPNVLHVHECPTQRPTFLRAVLLLAQRTSDSVVFNSEYTREMVRRYEPRLSQRGIVVHIGVDLPPLQRSAPHAGRLSVCCPARIHPKKGQSVLVQAVGRAAAEGRCWDVHLYGDTLSEHEGIRVALERDIAALGLADQFHWHGFFEDVAAMYAGADVCVVPSVVPEEFSMVCLEAQAFGRPVIATGPGGPSEVIVDGETGMIVAPKDPGALAAAMMRLDDDVELRRRMGDAGRERVRTHFARTAYGAKIAAVCEAALPAPRGLSGS